MKKKPHHSTVFRRKATEQINQLQNQVNVLTEVNRSLQSAVRRLEDDRKPLDVKLVSLSTKLSATVEGRDNLLKTVEEKQQTIDRLTAALREIYEATIGVVIDPEMDPAIQALNAVKDQMAHSERLAKGLNDANARIEALGSDAVTLKRNHESALAGQEKLANCLARIHQIATGREVPSGLSTPGLCVEVESAVMALEEILHVCDGERGRIKEALNEMFPIECESLAPLDVVVRSGADKLKRNATFHHDRATFLESQLRKKDNTCGKLMAGLIALGAIVIGVAIYNL